MAADDDTTEESTFIKEIQDLIDSGDMSEVNLLASSSSESSTTTSRSPGSDRTSSPEKGDTSSTSTEKASPESSAPAPTAPTKERWVFDDKWTPNAVDFCGCGKKSTCNYIRASDGAEAPLCEECEGTAFFKLGEPEDQDGLDDDISSDATFTSDDAEKEIAAAKAQRDRELAEAMKLNKQRMNDALNFAKKSLTKATPPTKAGRKKMTETGAKAGTTTVASGKGSKKVNVSVKKELSTTETSGTGPKASLKKTKAGKETKAGKKPAPKATKVEQVVVKKEETAKAQRKKKLNEKQEKRRQVLLADSKGIEVELTDQRGRNRTVVPPAKTIKRLNKRLFDPKMYVKPTHWLHGRVRLVAPKRGIPPKGKWDSHDAEYAYCQDCDMLIKYAFGTSKYVTEHYELFHEEEDEDDDEDEDEDEDEDVSSTKVAPKPHKTSQTPYKALPTAPATTKKRSDGGGDASTTATTKKRKSDGGDDASENSKKLKKLKKKLRKRGLDGSVPLGFVKPARKKSAATKASGLKPSSEGIPPRPHPIGIRCAAGESCRCDGMIDSPGTAKKCEICKKYIHIQCSMARKATYMICINCLSPLYDAPSPVARKHK
jgi:hypothetical protein